MLYIYIYIYAKKSILTHLKSMFLFYLPLKSLRYVTFGSLMFLEGKQNSLEWDTLREKCPNTEFFSGLYFPVFGLIYSVNLRVQSKYKKIRTRKSSVFGHFSRTVNPFVRQALINPFHSTGLFLHPLKTSENQRFSDVFRGYRKQKVT